MATKKKSNDEKVKELLARAEKGIKEVFEGENYKRYLATMAKFHQYSARNTLLILMQNPNASMVAGYQAWQNNFKRQVQRGQTGIQIIGYSPRKISVETSKEDENGIPLYDPDGKPITETKECKIPQFYFTYVWDVSQTQGEPLPQLTQNLTGDVMGYQTLMQAITDVSPFPITFEEPAAETVRGFCDFRNQRIVIRPEMSEAQTVKTAVHELTHSFLHDPSDTESNAGSRRTAEIEAESTAFVVCEHYGLDTSDYSFPYLANWSSDHELKELQHSLDTIQHAVNELIEKIDHRLTELQRAPKQDIERPTNETRENTVRSAFAVPVVVDCDDEHPATNFEDYVRKMQYPDPTWVDMPAETNEFMTALINAGQISPFAALRIGNHSVRTSDGWRLTEKVNYSFDDAGHEGLEFPDVSGMKQLLHERWPERTFIFPDEQQQAASVEFYTINIGSDAVPTMYHSIMEAYDAYAASSVPGAAIGYYYASTSGGGVLLQRNEDGTDHSQRDNLSQDALYNKDISIALDYIDAHIHTPEFQAQRDAGYGIFYAGPGGQDKEAHEFQLQTGWNVVFGSDSDGLNGDTWVVYRQLSDLPVQLQKVVSHLSQSKTELPSYRKQVQAVYEHEVIFAETERLTKYSPEQGSTVADLARHVTDAQIEAKFREIEPSREQTHARFEQLASDSMHVDIYQLRHNVNNALSFASLQCVGEKGLTVSLANYDKVYHCDLTSGTTLEDIYTRFNLDHPEGFIGHSLSVSDIVAIDYPGAVSANYCDSVGFENLPEIARQIKRINYFVAHTGKIEYKDNPYEVIGSSGDRIILQDVNSDYHVEVSLDQIDLQTRRLALLRQQEEILDTVRYDGEIDADKVRQPSLSMKERFAAAVSAADKRNAERQTTAKESEKSKNEHFAQGVIEP